MSNDKTLLQKAQHIPVPELGEIITIKSVELLCVWMKLHNRKVLRWQGNLLVTVAEKQIASDEEQERPRNDMEVIHA